MGNRSRWAVYPPSRGYPVGAVYTGSFKHCIAFALNWHHGRCIVLRRRGVGLSFNGVVVDDAMRAARAAA
jgi:hypothetical protein